MLFSQPETGSCNAEMPSIEQAPWLLSGVERDCHFQATIHPAQKQVSQTAVVNQTLKIPSFPPPAQKCCRHPPQTVRRVLQVFTIR